MYDRLPRTHAIPVHLYTSTLARLHHLCGSPDPFVHFRCFALVPLCTVERCDAGRRRRVPAVSSHSRSGDLSSQGSRRNHEESHVLNHLSACRLPAPSSVSPYSLDKVSAVGIMKRHPLAENQSTRFRFRNIDRSVERSTAGDILAIARFMRPRCKIQGNRGAFPRWKWVSERGRRSRRDSPLDFSRAAGARLCDRYFTIAAAMIYARRR